MCNSRVFRLRSGQACLAAALAIGALLVTSSPASAQCNANLFDISIVADRLVAVPGETVNYRVIITNRSEQAGFIGCDVENVTADFFCPDATGAPTVFEANVVTDRDFPADNSVNIFPPLTDPAFTCIMPNIDGFAFAEVRGPAANLVNEQGQIIGAVTIQKSIAVNVLRTQVRVDKQVSCNGAPFVDAMLVVANDDGINGCSAVDGQPVAVQYQVQNAGESGLFQCVLTVTQANNTPSSFSPLPIPIGNLTSGQTTPLIPAVNSPQACSQSLENEEPDTARVSCCTVNQSPCPEGLAITAFDVATFTCQSRPELAVEKVCVDQNNDGIGEITVTVTASAADLDLVNCQATDNLFRDDPTCPADQGAATLVPLSPPNPFNVPAGGQVELTGLTPAPPLTANACNTVSVTCTIESTSETLTESADAVCPGAGEGCLTRTPGFWGNHPRITALFLPQTVCGVELDTVEAGDTSSATEAICSVGNDGKILGPQLTQLVRQCTAAVLNVVASASGGGNCPGDFPPLTSLLEDCCGFRDGDDGGSVCQGNPPVPGPTIQSCIDQLDAFNNSPDTLPPFGPFVSPGPADSSKCRDSRNNGVVVTPMP
jgi:hypothetical protein